MFKGTLAGAVAVIALLSSTPVYAAPFLSGSFTGVANITTPGPDGRGLSRTDVPTTGTFNLDVSSVACSSNPGPLVCSAASLVIFANAGGNAFTFSAPGNSVLASNSATAQTLRLIAGFTGPGYQTALTLRGPLDSFVTITAPAGTFASATELQSLHPGPVDLAGSSLSISARSSLQGTATLTSVVFNDVPEPSSVLILLFGVGLAGALAGTKHIGRRVTRQEPQHSR